MEWAGTCTCGAVPVRVLCRGAGVNGRCAAPAAELQLRQIDSLLEAAGLREGHHSTADAVAALLAATRNSNVADFQVAAARRRHPAGGARR